MTSVSTGITETVATAIDVVGAILQAELVQNSVLLPTVMDYSSWVVPGANTVKVPNAGSFTAGDKVENTASDFQALTFATDDIELSVYKHIVAEVEDRAKEQAAVDVEGEYIRRMATAMVEAIESSIAGVIVKSANDIQLSATGAVANDSIAKVDILEARKDLDDLKVPQSDRFLVIPPAQEKVMLQIDDFVDASKYGSTEAIQNGELGRIFGMKVIKTTSLSSDTEAVIYHRSHAAFARQLAPKFEKQRASLSKLADELSLSLLYGVKQLDSGNRGIYLDESAVA